ncbi:MAG: hypothetical protein BWY63_03317 [Chloroflexi bacterium ADurb.Bin360]|nr:MAG: hypothetical protein BWY63_03317 [Chloroflexi bacterium ADurb.Bin360]
MAVFCSGEILASFASVGNDDPDVADFHNCLRDHFHCGKQPVEVIRTFYQHLELSPSQAAGIEKVIGRLEVVVIGSRIVWIIAHNGGDDFALRQRRTIMHRDDASKVVGVFDYHGAESISLGDDLCHVVNNGIFGAVQRQVVDALLRDYDELRQVDGIRAFAENLPLRSPLSAAAQEVLHILEIIRGDIAGEGLCCRQWYAIAGKDVADAPLRDGNQWFDVDPVLDGEEIVQTTAQHVRLITRFAVQRDEALFQRAFRAPAFFDNADPVVRDVANAC